MTAEVTQKDMVKAILNCYPHACMKLYAVAYYKRNGKYPFNPRLN